MDRQTLSNYGWIVIAVLILAVMLAFATPFGQYIGRGVSNFAKSLVGASDNAVDKNNIDKMDTEWEIYLNSERAIFTDGTILTFDELKHPKNGTKYGYNASYITDTTINNNAFLRCERLKAIDLSGTQVTRINQGAFYCCTLISITLPDTVTYIGQWAFYECHSLASITFEGTIAQWNAITFGGEAWNQNIPATVVHCSDGDVTL